MAAGAGDVAGVVGLALVQLAEQALLEDIGER
jgi:hypothetical protein